MKDQLTVHFLAFNQTTRSCKKVMSRHSSIFAILKYISYKTKALYKATNHHDGEKSGNHENETVTH